MLNTGFKPHTRAINVILMNGGVGDHMSSLIAVDYIKRYYAWIHMIVWMPDYLIDIAKHLLPDCAVKTYTSMAKEYDPKKTTITTKWDGITSPMKIHCADYAFLKLCDENPSIEYKNSLHIRPNEITIKHQLPDKYVVITAGYTAKVREFPAKSINAVSNYIQSKGYNVVFLGQRKTITGSAHVIEGNFDEHINFDKCQNLIDQTTLLEAAKIMHNAKAVIGVDNGLLHVAGCTDTNIVAGYTTVNPGIRMPIRNNILGYKCYPVTPEATLECRFCQQTTNFLYGHDYRQCLRKDFECTNQMTSDKFINILKDIL